MSPLADWQVNNIIPVWLAPNVITLLGFICVLLPHLWLWYNYPGDLSGDIPRSFCYVCGILHLIYMNLDNIDGK
jgi:ethanolaminephosphotransferase